MGPFQRNQKKEMQDRNNAEEVLEEDHQPNASDAEPQQDLEDTKSIANSRKEEIISDNPPSIEETGSEHYSQSNFQGFMEDLIQSIRRSMSDVFRMSTDESARLLQHVADRYNISIDESRLIAVASTAYNKTRNGSAKLSNEVLDVISHAYGVSKEEAAKVLSTIAQSYNISADTGSPIKHLSQAYNASGNFLFGVFNTSRDKSISLLTQAAASCNIATGNTTTMTCLSNAYNMSKAESSKLLGAVVRAYNNSKVGKSDGSHFRTLFRNDPSLSMDSFYGIAAVAVIVFILNWARGKLVARRRKVQFGGEVSDNDPLSNIEGMKILRSTRDRSSTYDFFGMHLNQARGRSGSFEELSRSSRGRSSSVETFGPPQIKRERVGSMDIFYSRAKMEKTKPRLATQTSVSTGSPRANLAPEEYVRSQLLAEENEEEGFLYDEFGLVTLVRVRDDRPSALQLISNKYLLPRTVL